MLSFVAAAVAAEELDRVDVIAFAENEDGTGKCFMVQRSRLPTTLRDIELGHDTYCLVLDDVLTFYGGIERWTLDGSTLSLRLEKKAAGALEIKGNRRIEIELPEDADRERLRERLLRTFRIHETVAT